jgi:hypothetical protein
MHDCPDLTHAELYFAYYDDVVVGSGPSHLSVGICRVLYLQPIHLLGVDGLDGVGLV